MYARMFVVTTCACLVVAAGGAPAQTIDWQGTDTPTEKDWFDPLNWIPQQVPSTTDDAKHLLNSPGSPDIVIAPSDAAFAKTFEGQLASAPRSITIGMLGTLDSSASLQAVGDIFRTGTGGNTYTINIGSQSTLEAGAGLQQDADLYGFRLVFSSPHSFLPGFARASRTVGYGPVRVVGSIGTPITFARIQGGEEGSQMFHGTIDCAYAGMCPNPSPPPDQIPCPPVDPTTASPWEIGDGSDYRFQAFAGTVQNVGDWFFNPVGSGSTVETNIFRMYPINAQMETWKVLFEINNEHFTAPPVPPSTEPPPPQMTFPGNSLWKYGLAGQNHVTFGAIPDPMQFCVVTFSGPTDALRPALLRPTSYPTVPLLLPSLVFEAMRVPTFFFVNSRVAREALAFDTALADWDVRTEVDLESYTPDVCNVEFMDFLIPDPGLPVSCFPTNNRCVKYWKDMLLGQLVLFDMADNQDPLYKPLNYPREANYFCNIASNEGTVSGDVRLYARSVQAPSIHPILLALTRYMDGDADYDVDLMDFSRFQDSFTGDSNLGGNRATWYPLADFGTSESNPDADCDVDLLDFAVFRKRWHESGTGFMVCDAEHLPLGNSNLTNGSPDTLVCGGPLHLRPGAPELDCPNCQMYGLGCGEHCAQACPWEDTHPVNMQGRFSLAVVDQFNCSPCINASAGDTVYYKIVGLLHGIPEGAAPADDGLALWSANLSVTVPAGNPAAELTPLRPPADGSDTGVKNFSRTDHDGNATNLGIDNPAGYGGTLVPNPSPDPNHLPPPGTLVQIGGAQNTIKNTSTYAPFPIGDAIGDIAHDWVTLAEGTLVIPVGANSGIYELRLSDVFANVIADNEIAANGDFYRTERVDVRSVHDLRIRVHMEETVAIDSANPPRDNPYIPGIPFRDPLQTGTSPSLTQGIGAAGTPAEGPYDYARITVTFASPPSPPLGASDVVVRCSYSTSATPCPNIVSVTAANSTTFNLQLDGSIPPGGCATMLFAQSCDVLQYEYLPGDVNQDGRSNTQDLGALVTALNNGTANLPGNLARYDINRSGNSNTQDLLRLVQLLNGVNTTQVWSGVEIVPCMAGAPVCGDSGLGGSNASSGFGGESPGSGGDDGGSTEGWIAQAIAAIQGACAEGGIEAAECQQMIDNLFGSQP